MMTTVTILLLVLLVTPLSVLHRCRAEEGTAPAEQLECPLWFVRDGDTCECGDSIDGLVRCSLGTDNNNASLAIAPYTCMTYDEELNATVFGDSRFCNLQMFDYYPLPVTENWTAFNEDICGSLNRQGRLCEECKDDYIPRYCAHPPVCSVGNYSTTLLLSAAMYIGFTTILFIAALYFRVDVLTPPLTSFILFNQYIYYIFFIWLNPLVTKPPFSTIVKIMNSFYGILNLNYFDDVIPYTCLIDSILLLDYVMRLYPLMLVVVTYICVEAHARNFKPIVLMWKPFGKIFSKLGKSWDLIHSILNVFVTFLVLLYVKLGAIAASSLQYVRLYTPSEKLLPSLYFYYKPSLEYFHDEHLPAAVLAIFFLPLLLIPPVFLILYPFKCFQRLLECLRLNRQGLRTFVDIFQGHFKDGTEGTRDWRSFSAVYFIARLLFAVELLAIGWSTYTPLAILVLIATCTPYKRRAYNVIECVIFAYYTALLYSINMHFHPYPNFQTTTLALVYLLYVIPGVCLVFYLISPLLKKMNCTKILIARVLALIARKHIEETQNPTSQQEEDPELPHRLAHSQSYQTTMPESNI